MTEGTFKAGDTVWAPMTIGEIRNGQVTICRDGSLPGMWFCQADIRPRADGAEPTLRAAALGVLKVDADEDARAGDLQASIDALRAALAEPVGTPVSLAESLQIARRVSEQAELRRSQAVEREAALAEAPIEGPVQEGDVVRLEGEVTEINPDKKTALIRVATTGLRTVWLMDVTIISRPAPAETCGRCRWFLYQDTGACKTCRHPAGQGWTGRQSPACDEFQPWPGA